MSAVGRKEGGGKSKGKRKGGRKKVSVIGRKGICKREREREKRGREEVMEGGTK